MGRRNPARVSCGLPRSSITAMRTLLTLFSSLLLFMCTKAQERILIGDPTEHHTVERDIPKGQTWALSNFQAGCVCYITTRTLHNPQSRVVSGGPSNTTWVMTIGEKDAGMLPIVIGGNLPLLISATTEGMKVQVKCLPGSFADLYVTMDR